MVLSEGWFRFGLPLGSAIILVGILDTSANLFTLWMDLGGVFIYHFNGLRSIDALTAIWIIVILIWNLSNLALLWVGGILKGNLSMLLAWIATTIMCGIVVLGIWIYSITFIWGFWMYLSIEMYSLFAFLITSGYLLNIAILCIKPLRANEPIEPIGKGIRHILKFYRDEPTLSAKFLLISELVMIAEYVFTRQVMVLAFNDSMGHEGDNSPAIIAEEYVIRALRFIISSVGLFFVVKGKLVELKYWGLVYLGGIIASAGIFIFILIGWSSEHPFFTIGYYFTFLLSLIYRSGILYCCMQVVQPYISSTSFLTLQEN